MRALLIALAVSAGLLQRAGAQSPATPPQAPVFKSGVELITVDVSVVDKNGQPVRSLRADQFDVTLDGKPRRVASAELIEFGAATATTGKPGSPTREMPVKRLFSTNTYVAEASVPGRLIYLAVDQASFRPWGARGAMEAARKFIDRLQPTDRVGLVAFPSPGPAVEASQDHQAVRAATEQIMGMADSLRAATGSQVQVSLGEAIDIRSDDRAVLDKVVSRECANFMRAGLEVDLQTCKQNVAFAAASIGHAAELQAGKSITGLQAVINGLARIRERKILVLVSAGLPVSDRIGGDLQRSGEVLSLGREAAMANLSLYVLHIDSTFFEAFAAQEGRRPGSDGDLWRDMSMMGTGLEIMAGSSGGSLQRVMTGAEAAFDRVLRETAAAYVLGVEPVEGDRDGKTHRINVKVNVRGVEARSRSEVMLPGKAARPTTSDERLTDLLRAPRVESGLPIRATTLTMARESGAGLRVFISAEIGDGLTGPVDMRVAYVVSDASGRGLGGEAQTLRLYPRATSKSASAAFLVDAAFKPGSYVLRLAATDPAGRAGSVEHPFTVGLSGRDAVRIGDLMMLDPLRRKEEGVAIVTDGELWGQSVETYVEFQQKPDPSAASTVTFGIADRAGAAPLLSFRTAATRKDAQSPWTAGVHLDLSQLPPGDYVAVATIADAKRELGRVERPLHVERRASPLASGEAAAAPRLRFAVGESGSLVRAFTRADVLRGDALNFFLARLEEADATLSRTAPIVSASNALRGGQFDDAIAALAAADATALSTTFVKGLALLGKGDLEQAADQFRASMRASADFLPAAFYLGACYAAGGKDRDAAGAWQTSLVTEADARIVYDVLADALLRLRDAEQATSVLLEARDKWAGDDSFVPRLAAAQAMLGRPKDALVLLEPYIARHKQDAEAILLALRLMYDTYSRGGRINTAAEDAATAREYGSLYAAAGGANVALVNRWVAFIAR